METLGKQVIRSTRVMNPSSREGPSCSNPFLNRWIQCLTRQDKAPKHRKWVNPIALGSHRIESQGFSSISVAQSYLTLCNPMDCCMPGFPVHHQLPELTQTLVHWVDNAIQPSYPLPSLLLPSIFPSIGVFWNESAVRISWPKYWSFSFSISPSNEHSGLISFRVAWFEVLVRQGILKCLLQHHSSKASLIQHTAFFIVQVSHPYMTTRKTIASTRQICVGKVVSLLFNMLSRLVIAFLPRSKCLLISWL